MTVIDLKRLQISAVRLNIKLNRKLNLYLNLNIKEIEDYRGDSIGLRNQIMCRIIYKFGVLKE